MPSFKFPLINVPQNFEISLADINYLMTVKWNNSIQGGWVFDLYDANSNTPIVMNTPMITGADCFEGLEYLGIGGEIFVLTDGDPKAVPTFENLGVNSNLYFVTPD